MLGFEYVLTNIAQKCQIDYGGAMGAVGFLYGSVKDNLRWNSLSRKKYTNLLMGVGRYLVMEEKELKKIEMEQTNMSSNNISTLLIQAFGGDE